MAQRTRPGAMANAWAEAVWREEIENADDEEHGLPSADPIHRPAPARGGQHLHWRGLESCIQEGLI